VLVRGVEYDSTGLFRDVLWDNLILLGVIIVVNIIATYLTGGCGNLGSKAARSPAVLLR
jgi:hypothetical protein